MDDVFYWNKKKTNWIPSAIVVVLNVKIKTFNCNSCIKFKNTKQNCKLK